MRINQKKILIISMISIVIIIVMAIFLWLNKNYIFTTRDKQIDDYKPSFTNSIIEVIPGYDYYLYYKTDKTYTIGQATDLQIYLASDETTLNNKVAYIGSGYVGINLEVELTDRGCLFVYENGIYLPYTLRAGRQDFLVDNTQSENSKCVNFNPIKFEDRIR